MENTVEISGAENGWVVQVGCKKFIFADHQLADFLADLRKFMGGGYEASRELRKKYLKDQPIAECAAAPYPECPPLAVPGVRG
jgi:hypothetical protein